MRRVRIHHVDTSVHATNFYRISDDGDGGCNQFVSGSIDEEAGSFVNDTGDTSIRAQYVPGLIHYPTTTQALLYGPGMISACPQTANHPGPEKVRICWV